MWWGSITCASHRCGGGDRGCSDCGGGGCCSGGIRSTGAIRPGVLELTDVAVLGPGDTVVTGGGELVTGGEQETQVPGTGGHLSCLVLQVT